jgi:ribose 5-phosphate isomerase B
MIYLASDHGGFAAKEKVKALLQKQNIEAKDLGPFRLEADDDYPDYIFPLAELVAEKGELGIISCRNGQGAAIAANKVKGVRAAVCWNPECARTSRTDDNANVLSLPADHLSDLNLEAVVSAWLETPFSQDARHIRRLEKVKKYEETV